MTQYMLFAGNTLSREESMDQEKRREAVDIAVSSIKAVTGQTTTCIKNVLEIAAMVVVDVDPAEVTAIQQEFLRMAGRGLPASADHEDAVRPALIK